jgi:hypothetical protein
MNIKRFNEFINEEFVGSLSELRDREDTLSETITDWMRSEKDGSATKEEILSEIDKQIGLLPADDQNGLSRINILNKVKRQSIFR